MAIDRVAHRHVRLEAAAGAHPDRAVGRRASELLEHDAALGHPMPVDCTLIGRPSNVPVKPSMPALGVHLAEAGIEERLGDVLRPQWIAGAEHVRRVVAGFGAQMDRHAGESNDRRRPGVRSWPESSRSGHAASIRASSRSSDGSTTAVSQPSRSGRRRSSLRMLLCVATGLQGVARCMPTPRAVLARAPQRSDRAGR